MQTLVGARIGQERTLPSQHCFMALSQPEPTIQAGQPSRALPALGCQLLSPLRRDKAGGTAARPSSISLQENETPVLARP